MIYLCRPCMAWVGIHSDGRPLGRLADSQLRQFKIDAHASFDMLWKLVAVERKIPRVLSRKKAYKWLREKMNLDKKYCHIGMFDVDQCNQVINLCAPYLKKYNLNMRWDKS